MVSMNSPQTHYFEVETLVPPSLHAGEKIRVVMPVWTPGSYLVREFSRNVLDLRASEKDTGELLKSYKDSKNSWIVETRRDRNSTVRIQYRVYAFEFTVDTSYLDARHGIINGASVFIYVDGRQNEEISLTIIPFREWKVIATSLDEVGALENRRADDKSKTFKAPNFDILVDSPIEMGNQDIESFEVEGVKHEVSMFGPKPIPPDRFVSDLKKIVEAEWKVFGVIPYKRYLFLVDFSGGAGGGLEHLSSTHCITPRLRLFPEAEYKLMMGLFSHEFFHAWNVKRMRPQGLGPFNYSSETYTKSLWIAEGITSYYDDYILRRAAIYNVGDYLDAFCITANQLKFLPSISYESAEESSFDTWIRHYRPNENTPNTHSSYYFQGAIIGWMLDMEIRKSTRNSKSLDDAMRKLYEKTYVKEGRGYTGREFEEICEELGGKSAIEEIFGARVRGHEPVDFNRYLGYAGLTLGTKSKGTSSFKGYLGVKVKGDSGKIVVASKLFSTPAAECGIAAGDEIIALDNLRVDASTLGFYISNKKPGEKISILISRDGYLESLEATLAEAPQFDTRIYKKDNATPEEKELFEHWMLQDWDTAIEYPDYVASPARIKTLDFV
jgi:predicted metalloprotease with PDZ domain